MPVMTPADQLRMMVAAEADPTLSENEIHTLLELNQRKRLYNFWEPSTAYSVGTKVTPSPRNGLVYVVTDAGTSDNTQPPFDDADGITDGTVKWDVFGTEDAFNLRSAAAEGWRIKAGRVANRYDMKTDVSSTSRSQLYKQCMDMYKSYRNGRIGSIPVINPYAIGTVESVIANVNPAP